MDSEDISKLAFWLIIAASLLYVLTLTVVILEPLYMPLVVGLYNFLYSFIVKAGPPITAATMLIAAAAVLILTDRLRRSWRSRTTKPFVGLFGGTIAHNVGALIKNLHKDTLKLPQNMANELLRPLVVLLFKPKENLVRLRKGVVKSFKALICEVDTPGVGSGGLSEPIPQEVQITKNVLKKAGVKAGQVNNIVVVVSAGRTGLKFLRLVTNRLAELWEGARGRIVFVVSDHAVGLAKVKAYGLADQYSRLFRSKLTTERNVLPILIDNPLPETTGGNEARGDPRSEADGESEGGRSPEQAEVNEALAEAIPIMNKASLETEHEDLSKLGIVFEVASSGPTYFTLARPIIAIGNVQDNIRKSLEELRVYFSEYSDNSAISRSAAAFIITNTQGLFETVRNVIEEKGFRVRLAVGGDYLTKPMLWARLRGRQELEVPVPTALVAIAPALRNVEVDACPVFRLLTNGSESEEAKPA